MFADYPFSLLGDNILSDRLALTWIGQKFLFRMWDVKSRYSNLLDLAILFELYVQKINDAYGNMKCIIAFLFCVFISLWVHITYILRTTLVFFFFLVAQK